jgi:hypothetical protein
MNKIHFIFALLFTVGTAASAQVEPAATGPRNPLPSGDLSYSARYSQSAEFGSDIGNYQISTLSGDVDYANGNERHPFSLSYGGGYTWNISGPGYAKGLFQHLFVSQGFVWRKWNAMITEDVTYTPEAPTTGFSGVAGSGEPIGVTNPSPPSSASILTVDTHVLNNVVMGTVTHQLDYARSLELGGSFGLLRFPDGNGINDNSDMAHAELSQRLNARNTLTGTYMFSAFTYPDYDFSLMVNTGMFGLTRVWTRKITTNVSAGPQWTESLNSTTPPPQVGVSVNASATYSYHFQTASVSYVRGINSGGGYLLGAESDSLSGSFSQDFGRNFTVGLTGSYRRTSGLGTDTQGQSENESIGSEIGAIQATRHLGRYLTFFAGYTALQQSSTSTVSGSVLNGLEQIVNFGVGYSPREMHLKH